MFAIVSSLVTLISEVIISGYYHESSDCFEYPPKTRLKSGQPKRILDKLSYPKKFFGSSIVGTELSFFAHESH